jgi:hypothetical protein
MGNTPLRNPLDFSGAFGTDGSRQSHLSGDYCLTQISVSMNPKTVDGHTISDFTSPLSAVLVAFPFREADGIKL